MASDDRQISRSNYGEEEERSEFQAAEVFVFGGVDSFHTHGRS